MSTIPIKYAQAIAWMKTRVPIWSNAGTAIGVDPVQIAELGTQLSAVEDALAEYNAALADAEAKGEIFRNAFRAARKDASGQVSRIRGFARTAPDPAAIYAAAQIPEPAKRSPSPAPGMPEAFRVALDLSGDLRFTFRCDNPPRAKGVTYVVRRQNEPQGPFEFLTLAKDREFVDSTFPNTSTLISYMVTAQTATRTGPNATLAVRYGSPNQPGVGGATIVSQGPATDTKVS